MQTGALAPANATPGRILAAARTERGMSVSEVAQRLKFSLRHIEALESDRYDALPSGPFVRGMIRTYARLLGVDPAGLLEALPRANATGEAAMQPSDMSVPFPQGPRTSSRVYLLLSMLIIVAVAVVLAEWLIRGQRDASPDAVLPSPMATTGQPVAEAEPVQEQLQEQVQEQVQVPVPSTAESGAGSPQSAAEDAGRPPAPETTSVPPAGAAVSPELPPQLPPQLLPQSSPMTGATSPAPVTASVAAERAVSEDSSPSGSTPAPAAASEALAPGRSQLSFTFEIESWIEVRDARGDVIVSALNSAGTTRDVRGTAPFTLVVGNASGVRLTYKGEPVVLTPHRASDVARLTLE